MQKYKVTGPRAVLDAAPGGELEHDFTAEEEADMIAAGRLQIVPRAYQVVGTRNVRDTPPGGFFTAALPKGQEQALIDGGHIERHDPKLKKKE